MQLSAENHIAVLQLRQSPDDFYFQQQYIEYLASQRRVPDARAYVESIRTKHSPYRHLLLSGMVFFFEGHQGRARPLWQEAAPEFFTDAAIRSAFEQFLIKQGLYGVLLELLVLIPPEERSVDDYWSISSYAHMTGQLQTALRALFQILIINEDFYGRVQQQMLRFVSDQPLVPLLGEVVQEMLTAVNKDSARQSIRRLEISVLISASAHEEAQLKSAAFMRDYPSEHGFFLNIIRSLRGLAQEELALQLLNALPSQEMPEQLLLEYAQLLAASEPERALAYADVLGQSRSLQPAVRQLRFTALGTMRRYDEALEVWKSMVAPPTALRIKAGSYALLASRYREAAELFSRLPGAERAYYSGLTAVVEKNREAAEDILGAFTANPGSQAVVHHALGLLYVLRQMGADGLDGFAHFSLAMLADDTAAAAGSLAGLAQRMEGAGALYALISAARLYVYAGLYDMALELLDTEGLDEGALADHVLFWKALALAGSADAAAAKPFLLRLVAGYPDSVYLYYARELLEQGFLLSLPRAGRGP